MINFPRNCKTMQTHSISFSRKYLKKELLLVSAIGFRNYCPTVTIKTIENKQNHKKWKNYKNFKGLHLFTLLRSRSKQMIPNDLRKYNNIF